MIRRNTLQKEIVIKTIQDIDKHVTADEIYSYINRIHPSISKATIYRILNVLVEEGQITKVDMPSGPTYFDKRLDKHHHVKCIKCQQIYDVDISIPDLENCGWNMTSTSKVFVPSVRRNYERKDSF